jgi:cytochrome P450
VVDGRPLTDEEVLLNCYNLVIGGDETARLAMSGGLLALIQNPAQLARLRAEPDLIEPAVEEILRWTTPASHIGRTVTADTEVAGVPMAAGDVVTLWLKSANRDETVFDRPEVFDIGRSPNKHATFGHGQHFCLGAHLSRVEIRALLRTLIDEVTDIRQTGEPAYQESNFLTGVNSLPVAFTR